jgi:hypothetical protein
MTPETKFQAQGLAYDPQTRDWTLLTTYDARNKIEAIRWCNFNRDWMKGLKVVEMQA